MAVVEWNHLTVWDLQRGVCVRQQPAPDREQPLNSVSVGAQVLAVVGDGRSVHTFDLFRWVPRGHWSCTKYEGCGVQLSLLDERLSYVCGRDSELVCGAWSTSSSAPSYESALRSPSRWAGFRTLLLLDVATDAAGAAGAPESTLPEALFAINEAGTLFIVRNSVNMFPGAAALLASDAQPALQGRVEAKKRAPQGDAGPRKK